MNSEIKKGKDPEILSFGLLFAGLLFLCNPNINLFDLLPDAIGYGLLMLALRRSTEVFPYFDAAHQGFYKLFIINLLKIPAIFIMLYITGADLEERAIITVFALSFAILEWIFAIPAFRALFEGFTYIGEREGATVVFRLPDGKIADKLILLTMVFLGVKGATSFLPETVYLFAFSDALATTSFNPAVLYPFFAIIGALIALAVGLYFIVSYRAYLRMLRDDPTMKAVLAKKASELALDLRASDEKRKFRIFFFLLLAAFFFNADLLIGNSDLLPNCISAISFFFALRLMGEDAHSKRAMLFSGVYFIVSLATAIFSALFHAKFKYTDILFRDAAYTAYIPVVIAQAIEAILFILVLFGIVRVLSGFVLAHTGKALRAEDLVLRNEVHATLFKRLRRLKVFGILYAILRPVSAVLMTVTERYVITEGEANDYYAEGTVLYSSRFSYLWIVLLVCGAALFAYALSLFNEMKNEANISESDE